MKGKKLPVSFKFVLQLSDHNTDWLLGKISFGTFEGTAIRTVSEYSLSGQEADLRHGAFL